MDKINEILNNKKYNYYLNKLYEYEKERKFCIHDMEHFLAVARIAYIKVLEEGLSYSKDVIYAIGLLHDIGRALQYENNTPHDEGSIIIGKEILEETSYSESEKEEILRAIKNHREIEEDSLSKIIYISDKLSRNCFNCKALKECYWSNEKKNFKIKY